MPQLDADTIIGCHAQHEGRMLPLDARATRMGNAHLGLVGENGRRQWQLGQPRSWLHLWLHSWVSWMNGTGHKWICSLHHALSCFFTETRELSAVLERIKRISSATLNVATQSDQPLEVGNNFRTTCQERNISLHWPSLSLHLTFDGQKLKLVVHTCQ